MKNNPCTICLILSLSILNCVVAQQAIGFDFYKTKYPNSRSVRLNQETIIRLELKDDAIDVRQEFYEEHLYLDRGATYNSKESIDFSAFFELEKVEASVYNLVDKKYAKIDVNEFTTKDNLEGVFHNDTRSLSFIYPNLKEGSRTVLNYSEKVNNPRFLNALYFGSFYPIVKNKISIIADEDIELRFKEFNLENLNITFKTEKKRGNVIYTWELENVDEYKYEDNVLSYKNILPHIIPIITSYKSSKNETINLLNDVSDLYGWYQSMVKNINRSESSPELVQLVEELTRDKVNELEKVKAMYYWVQQNIKYIAFEYALGGFIPREANDVFKKKYGDCKDNSSILLEMLKIAGIKGNLAWIGTRRIPYKYEEVPTPVVDNHMILSYNYEGKNYFLDATGRYVPIDFPTSFIQGKEALVAKDSALFIIEKVPVVPALNNALIDTTTLNIVSNNLVGRSKTQISGYKKIDIFQTLEDKNTETQRMEFYNYALLKGSNKFLIKELKETNKYDYENDFILDYTFSINDYIKSLGDEIYINLNLNKELSAIRTEENRKYETDYDQKEFYSYTTLLNIPEGYKVDYVPSNLELSNDFITIKINYRSDGNKLWYSCELKLDFLSLNIEQQKELNALINKADKYCKEVIVLKKY